MLIAFVMVVAMLAAPAAASPPDHAGDAQPSVAPGLIDRDGDGISDDLAAKLSELPPQERIDVVVTWVGPSNVAAARRAAGSFTIRRHFSLIDGFAATMTAAQAHAIGRVPGVFRVEEDFDVTINIDDAAREYGIDAARAEFAVSGAGVNFCVLDTGIDLGHEQLDAQSLFRDPGVDYWEDFISGQPSEYDDHGHGTHVASILAGDGEGVSADAVTHGGVAPGTRIMAGKVLNASGSGTESQIIAGIEWCVSSGADGISMSLGTSAGSDGNDGLSQAVNAAVQAGVVSIVAAGNSGDGTGTVGAPGAASGALTVGAASKISDGPYLAPFSSRGPTLSGLTKPDITAPGVAIVAADAGTTAGYVALSGTSMATPFTAGAVALMLQCSPHLDPDQIREMLIGTALDMGLTGTDNNWGAGLLDGSAAIAGACAGDGGIELRTHENFTAKVIRNKTWTHEFIVGADGVGEPIAATILIEGEMVCVLFCLLQEWSPDLDARLLDPFGAIIATSECPLRGDCGAHGQQETLQATAQSAGTYKLEVYPYSTIGSDIVVDLFYGPLAGSPPPPPPPPPGNSPPNADAGADQTVVDTDQSPSEWVTLDGSGSSDPDGDALSYAWSENGTELATGETTSVHLSDGIHVITLVVTDTEGASDTDTVTFEVESAPPAVGTSHVGDLDGSTTSNRKGRWQASVDVAVHDDLDRGLTDATVSFSVSDGTTRSCTTDASGTCSVTSRRQSSNAPSIEFAVVSIDHATLTYSGSDNHDSDGDSDGTEITVYP
ncbi:MAG: S8 family serine peptidase [Acidimicrobiia bacterium]|nr:S8 family serine peptidase [Acidimicrobiia bacterium]